MARSDIIQLHDVTVDHATDLAYLVNTGRTDKIGQPVKIWVPKSQSDWDGECLQLPRWLAEDKGLV